VLSSEVGAFEDNMFLPRAKPTRSLIISLIVFLVCAALLWEGHPSSFERVTVPGQFRWTSMSRGQGTDQVQVEFWKAMSALLALATPKCHPPKKLCTATPAKFDGVNSSTDATPQKCLSMPEVDMQAMQESHQRVVINIETNPPILSYQKGTRGLVTTAGAQYLPNVIISLRMLRKTGCRLPMEVFLSTQREWETYICETVLPKLNAKCIVQSSHFRTTANTEPPSRYQNKIVAILTSSFEELLFIDADCFPVKDFTPVFDSEPFMSTGLITFPDYWASTASQLYYDIIQKPLPPLTARQTTESGEIFISKRTHEKTLLLAMYYNHFGKKFYYPLLSQGASGEGDKDTFLAAAEFFDEPYYAVHARVRSLGHRVDGRLDGSTMIQHDPVEDYLETTKEIGNPAKDPRVLFVHNNYPKINPRLIWNEHAHIIHDAKGELRRPWTADKELLDSFGFDVQRSHWEEILWTACNLEDKFQAWEGVDGICDNTKVYFNMVFGAPS
jgi:alpha 1,2-mannosyltransferase